MKSDIIFLQFSAGRKKEAEMNIMVIGGSGLFGRKTVMYLLRDAGVASVVSVDLTPPPDWFLKSIEKFKDKFHFVRGDVTQLEDIMNPLKQYSIDRLINWAFIMVTEDNAEPRRDARVNAFGMSNAFEAAKLMGVKR